MSDLIHSFGKSADGHTHITRAELSIGESYSGLKIEEVIGRGAFSTVYDVIPDSISFLKAPPHFALKVYDAGDLEIARARRNTESDALFAIEQANNIDADACARGVLESYGPVDVKTAGKELP